MTYQLLLTTLGQQKLASAASAGGQPVHITEFATGQGVNVDFSKRLDQQVLVSKRYQGNVESVTSTAVAGQYEITCIVPQDQGGWAIREIGLIDSEGSLIWVGQVPEVQKPVASSTAAVDYRIKAVINIDNPNVNLVIDANVVTATQAWVANNFVSNPRFAQFLNLAFPFGYPYWTHSKSNPKPLFDAMFGFETHWRRLEGIGLVAVKDGDAYIGQPMLTLGQVGTTELATTVRPHTYPIHTSYLFERYDPSTVVETVWKVVANKTSINEGDAVQFTVTANNLPDGQILSWSAKEGALNSSSNDISSPEKTDSGTVILKNGQAIINFTTTSDDNSEEPQKHVRLVVGAPANLSINVPINDAGHHETVMHISQSTTNGIDLAEYYKAQSGSYPSTDDTVRFIVDEGIDIIAADTTTPAVTEGTNWPVGATPIIENHGRILGRGGDAGLAVTSYYNSYNFELINLVTTNPEKGGDGGTAIKGNIAVDNYGFIAGGGGGGGGAGFFRFNKYGHGSSGGGGGGAPLGRRYPNPKSYEEYLEHFPATEKFVLPPLTNPTNGVTYDVYSSLGIAAPNTEAGSTLRANVLNANETDTVSSDLISLNGFRHFAQDGTTSFYIPTYFDESKTTFKLWSHGAVIGESGWVDLGLKQSTNATVDQKGTGGLAFFNNEGGTSALKSLSDLSGIDVTKNKGGDGGAIGESGEAAQLELFYTLRETGGEYGTARLGQKSELEFIIEPKDGGLAGYIAEGSVTITNYSNGVTKGR